MLDFLPEGLRGKLEPYSECFDTPQPSAGRTEKIGLKAQHVLGITFSGFRPVQETRVFCTAGFFIKKELLEHMIFHPDNQCEEH